MYLKKLGLVYEATNDNKSASETYKAIKTDYPESTEAQHCGPLWVRSLFPYMSYAWDRPHKIVPSPKEELYH